MRVVAIDGPAGSGKSTVARAVATRLGLGYLDTGAMYRSVALGALRKGIDPGDAEAVTKVARAANIDVEPDMVLLDGEDVTAEIRSPEVNRIVSAVAATPGVRAEMVRRQREWVERHAGAVVEGRDIGSVVFPDADTKIYLTATEAERSRRRAQEMEHDDTDAVAADLARRDEVDSNRAVSPLAVADGAVVIDTTGRSVDDVVEQIMSRL